MKVCCRFVLVVCLVLLNACATLETGSVTTTSQVDDSVLPAGLGWWYSRFRIEDEKDKPTLWHIDALIAGEIITPVFERHFAEVRVWRVYRRAADDDYGHVFSFIFYAPSQSARSICGHSRPSRPGAATGSGARLENHV